jgi:CSLREA domain-containing protein
MRVRVKGWLVLPVVVGAGVGLVACRAPLELTVTTPVDGHDAAPGDGVCEMTPGLGDCSLRAAIEEADTSSAIAHITLTGGTYALDDGPLIVEGPSPSVTVQGDGSATVDAAGMADAVDVRGHVSLVGITVQGAAIDGIHVFGTADLVVAVSTVRNNGSHGIESDAASTVRVADSTLANNGRTGLMAAGAAELDRSLVSGNGNHDLGAVTVSAGATIADTTISHNPTLGLSSLNGTTNVHGSTIDHNESSWACVNAGCGSFGAGPGGIYVELGSLNLTNSTVSDNTVLSPFDGTITTGAMQVGLVTCGGPGCIFDSASASIVDSTVEEPTYVVFGSISAAGSALTQCRSSGLDNGQLAQLIDGGFNVITTASGCPFPSALQIPDLLVGPLADNGGPTQTRLPQPGSPLVDHIPIGAPGQCDGTIATDQRGVPRPVGPGCDVGAVELTS